MFDGISTDGPFGGGQGEAMFRSLMLDEYGKQIAAQGGIGLADAVTRELLKTQETVPVSADPQKIELSDRDGRTADRGASKRTSRRSRRGGRRSCAPPIRKSSGCRSLYSREAAGSIRRAPRRRRSDLRRKFFDTTAKFRDVLALHARLLTRMRNASEGIVKAVAEEVERRRAPTCIYAPAASYARPHGRGDGL